MDCTMRVSWPQLECPINGLHDARQQAAAGMPSYQELPMHSAGYLFLATQGALGATCTMLRKPAIRVESTGLKPAFHICIESMKTQMLP
eukprot:637751-Pelagomonas_calceolata.AAC.6